MKKTPLRQIADKPLTSAETMGIVTLLLKDHRAMRKLMKRMKAPRATPAQIFKAFGQLEKLVHSHMTAEETALLNRIDDHPLFEGEALEGQEEHEIHRVVMASARKVSDPKRRAVRMKSFCEILEHHLDEEEEDLFPRFKKNTAKSTRRKIATTFLRSRKATKLAKGVGALAGRK